jgi:putative phosphoribosyl transferase
MIAMLAVPEDYLDRAKTAALAEIERRRALYLAGAPPVPVAGREAIVVDDGIATGATVAAALRAVRHRGPASVILAVPVAAPEAIARLSAEADEVVCLAAPDHFQAVGQYYDDFAQLDDAEVIALLASARQASGLQ